MKMTVSETAKLTGISVRTLHYYDEIGLLEPTSITEAGYRFYDEEALAVLQQILLYRELDFSLKEIRDILSAPDYQRRDALKAHKELLILKRKRLGRLIDLIDEMMRGESDMSFKEFDISEIEMAKRRYKEEVKARWGGTDAFAESEEKTAGYDAKKWGEADERMEEILKKIASCVHDGESPKGKRARQLVIEWKEYITDYYYKCTDEILSGLAEMYVGDGRFKESMDRAGEGTAEFLSLAIREYCS